MKTSSIQIIGFLGCWLLYTASAADPCGSLNFFPTAAQIAGASSAAAASVAVTGEVTCSGSQVCNWPSVLNKTAQEAYQADLGTSIAAGGLLNVAVKEYGVRQLRVFFRPSSPLLTQSANAMSCVLDRTPASTRKLSQAATYSVTTPGTWSYSVTLNGGGGAIAAGNRAAAATGDFSFSTEGTEDDKTTCATISIVLRGYTVSNAPVGFPRQITLPFTVCWYKHNGQATAKFDFGGCSSRSGHYTVNVSRIAPLAKNLTQQGDALLDAEGRPHLLIQPVIQVFGRLNKTIEGVLVEEGASFVNKYFLLPTDLKATDTLTLSLDDGSDLQEGNYHLSAKVAVVTKFPSLVDLQGPARINQTDIASIMGFTEYMGFLVRNGTDDELPLLGLQSRSRVPQISEIDVDKEGVVINAGDALTFRWQFVAAGTEKCYHDNVEVKSVPCASPMIVAARPFSANATAHNFSVVITDVCGNVKTANFSYSADGAKAISEVDYVDPTTMDEGSATSFFPTSVTGSSTRRNTGGTSAAPVATAGRLLRNAVAACAASMLLVGLLL